MKAPAQRKAPGAVGAAARGQIENTTDQSDVAGEYGTTAVAREGAVPPARDLQRRRLRHLGLMPATERLVAGLAFGEVPA